MDYGSKAPPPPTLGDLVRHERERTIRLKTKASDYLRHKNFPQLDGDPLSLESLLEAVLHYAEQDLAPPIDPEKDRLAMKRMEELGMSPLPRHNDREP